MKFLFAFVMFTAGAWLSGCASSERGLVLEPVGPSRIQPAKSDSNGRLVVYSVFDVHADSTSTDPDRCRHNDTRTILEGPVEVAMPPGTYRIVARANGYGVVTVPVAIQANRVTTVHLEGGGG